MGSAGQSTFGGIFIMDEVILAHLKKLANSDDQKFIIGYNSGHPDDNIRLVDGGIDREELSVVIWDLVKEWF